MDDYDYIVINDRLEECVKEIHGIVQAAKRASGRNMEFINQIRDELNVLSKGE